MLLHFFYNSINFRSVVYTDISGLHGKFLKAAGECFFTLLAGVQCLILVLHFNTR